MTDKTEPPTKSKGDIAHAATKGLIGSVPVVGNAGAELFAYVIQAPYEKRREEWMNAIGDAIAELRDNHAVDVESLKQDPAFTDTVLAATQAALKTRSEAKQRALRNVVVNSASPSAPDEALRLTFIRAVEELSDRHLSILALFQNPRDWFVRNGKAVPEYGGGGLSHVIEDAFPELRGRREYYDQWWRELHARGFVTVDQLHTTMSGRGMMEPRLTPIGKKFAAFIGDPPAAG